MPIAIPYKKMFSINKPKFPVAFAITKIIGNNTGESNSTKAITTTLKITFLEIFIKDDLGFDSPVRAFIEAGNWLMNFVWQIYVKIMYLVIAFLSWAFNLEIIDYVIDTYTSVIEIINNIN